MENTFKEAFDAIANKKLRQSIQQQIQRLTGVSTSTVHNWCKGRTEPPTWANRILQKIFKDAKEKFDEIIQQNDNDK